MSYDFWVRTDAVADLGSGCTDTTTPAWTGTVDVSGTGVTKATGDAFPTTLFDGTHFLRLDPDGAGDANIRIVSGNATTLVLAETGGTRTGATANIGGAFKTLEKAIGTATTASKIPYSNGTSIPLDINIWIKSGTYTLSDGLLIQSATQDTNHIRRRILGYGGGFVNGVFSGPVIVGGANTALTINAHGIVVGGIKTTASGFYNIVLNAAKYNAFLHQVYTSGGFVGFSCADGSSSNLLECRFDGHGLCGVLGYNTLAVRCVANNCVAAWGGSLSGYNACVEFGSTSNLLNIANYPGSIDFAYCRFTSNKQITGSPGAQGYFSHCVFDYALDNTSLSCDLVFENCVIGGVFTDQSSANQKYRSKSDINLIRQNSGIDNYSGVYAGAINLENSYPDATLDRYCKHATAGPHEYRFPVEAVGARALRNRTRVTHSEIGL